MLIPLLLLALQQGAPARAASARDTGFSTPPSRDTVGYWQQRTRYEVVARLDESRQVLVARGTLVYVNRSPDVLTELRLHQYLNAFRPGSAWSRDDAREGRVRFQNLPEHARGYERFTAPPTVDGTPVTVTYPGAPDSTVAHLALPRPLAPGDSITVVMAWEARPSLVARRQGRRGRQYDFAHWFPKVAVYDRGGWQDNPLVPAGEFYGEFGDWDVTLTLREDQVIGTTGVVVAGDPGWARVNRGPAPPVRQGAETYGLPRSLGADAPAADGEKTLRILARDVHHFAFSVSPDYRYEGGVYVRQPTQWSRWPVWDTVPVHVLYRPGDEAQWGDGQAVQRTVNAIGWLERVYGPYAYPQMTNLHRLDGGGTEFPMMMMNGSASQGLILHEGGHIYTYGILANNEWRNGWMDEGLTSYQTSWAQGLTRHERATGTATFPVRVPVAQAHGYPGLALRPSGPDQPALADWRAVVQGRAEPIGTRADLFRDFATYNNMIYGRAEMMYGALRDAIGDTAFTAFLRGYYARWGLKHVDEAAMRAEAERAAGRDLGWFFDQWVHRVGLIDYALTDVRTRRSGDGFVTRVTIVRRGDYRHPMPVGVRTSAGWLIVRGDPMRDRQTLEIRTSEHPGKVQLDPHRTTEDWYRPNDISQGWWIFRAPESPRHVVDWPFLEQTSADRVVTAWSPLVWTQREFTGVLGARWRTSYRGIVDRAEGGVGFYAQDALAERCRIVPFDPCTGGSIPSSRVQWYSIIENPRFRSRPVLGLRFAAAELDGVGLFELRRRWDRRPYGAAPFGAESRGLFLRYTRPFALDLLDRARWSAVDVVDAGADYAWQAKAPPGTWGRLARLSVSGGVTAARLLDTDEGREPFGVAELGLAVLRRAPEDRTTSFARFYAAWATDRAPRERLPTIATRSATDNFFNHWVRPEGGLLSNDDVPFILTGGAGLRGYDPRRIAARTAALNFEHALRLSTLGGGRRPRLFGTAFANASTGLRRFDRDTRLMEAGAGLALRGPLFDRELRLRMDFPFWVNTPVYGVRGPINDDARVRPTAFRVSFSAGDLW